MSKTKKPQSVIDEQKRQVDAQAEADALDAKAYADRLESNKFWASNLAAKKKKVSYCTKPGASKGWSALVKAYKKQYGDELGPDGILMFPSQEAALQFFKGQAEEGLIFFATRVQNGEELDEHVFSCGDKTLYHGSFAEIHAQLQAALALDPTHKKVIKGVKMWDALMPASSLLATELRNKVRDHRQDLEAKSPAAPSPVAHAKPAPSTRGK